MNKKIPMTKSYSFMKRQACFYTLFGFGKEEDAPWPEDLLVTSISCKDTDYGYEGRVSIGSPPEQ